MEIYDKKMLRFRHAFSSLTGSRSSVTSSSKAVHTSTRKWDPVTRGHPDGIRTDTHRKLGSALWQGEGRRRPGRATRGGPWSGSWKAASLRSTKILLCTLAETEFGCRCCLATWWRTAATAVETTAAATTRAGKAWIRATSESLDGRPLVFSWCLDTSPKRDAILLSSDNAIMTWTFFCPLYGKGLCMMRM